MSGAGGVSALLSRIPPQQRRLAVVAAGLVLVAVGLALAGSPGSLDLSAPVGWLLALLAVLGVAVLGWAAAELLRRHSSDRPARAREKRDLSQWWMVLLLAVLAAGVVWALSKLRLQAGKPPPPPPAHKLPVDPLKGPLVGGSPQPLNLGPWLVLALGVAVAALLVWMAVHNRRARRALRTVEAPEPLASDALIAAVEAALLDLDGEQDPRRAVIKAYARTEAVLRAHGLPRRPAEAPLEYLDRVLRQLGARAAAVDRLTELFERAAFSTHEIVAADRDEAIAAFHGLRDDLLAAAEEST